MLKVTVQMSDLDEFDIGPRLDNLTGDLVSEHQALGGHALVDAADACRDAFADRPRVGFRPI
jgi:hypothetical protein